MKLPSKVTNYRDSIFYISLKVIKLLNEPLEILDLVKRLKYEINSTSDIINTLTFLYSINKIKINENGEIEKC